MKFQFLTPKHLLRSLKAILTSNGATIEAPSGTLLRLPITWLLPLQVEPHAPCAQLPLGPRSRLQQAGCPPKPSMNSREVYVGWTCTYTCPVPCAPCTQPPLGPRSHLQQPAYLFFCATQALRDTAHPGVCVCVRVYVCVCVFVCVCKWLVHTRSIV
jgi:hypothetical protein